MKVFRLIRKNPSIYLFTVILSLACQVSSPVALASPNNVCGEWRSITDFQGRSINDIIAQATAVFAATDEGVFKSEDGLAWRPTSLRFPTYSLAPFKGGLLAGTEYGVYFSADGGTTWRELGLRGKRITALAVSGNVIYAGTDSGVYRREGEGDWKATSLIDSVKSLAADPANPNLVFAGTGGGVLGGQLGDLYVSVNGGDTWSRLWFSNTTLLAQLVAGVPLYYEVTSIAINLCNPREVYAGTFFLYTVFIVIPMSAGALHVSRDYGGSWSYTGPGLRCVFAVRVCGDCKTLTLGTDNGVYTSEDGGQSWNHLGPVNETVRAVESRGAQIYAGTLSGLLVFHRKTHPTRVSLTVEPTWIPSVAAPRASLLGNLTSLGEGLPGKSLKVLFNGVEIYLCRTGVHGGYECTVEWPATSARTVNLTVVYPGDLCYEASRASRLLHLVNATTAHGKAAGVGWYLEGSNATVSMSPTVVSEGFTEYVFKGWRAKGAIVSTDPILTLTVREPMDVEAVWEQKLSAVALAAIAVAAASLLFAVILVARERTREHSNLRV